MVHRARRPVPAVLLAFLLGWSGTLAAQELPRLLEQAHARFERGQYAEAAVAYERVLRLQPAHAVALNRAGISLQRAGSWRQAIARLDAGLRLQPEDVQARYARALAALALGSYADAQRDLEQLAAGRSALRAEVLHWLALVRSLQGDDAGALEAYDRALEEAPDNGAVRANRAVARYFRGRFADALADLKAAGPRALDGPFYYSNRAAVQWRLGDRKAAQADLERAASLVRDTAERAAPGRRRDLAQVLVNAGLLLRTAGRTERARNMLAQARDLAPDLPAAAFAFAELLLELGEPGRAASALTPLPPADTATAGALLELRSLAWLNAREFARAAADLERLLAAQPTHPLAWRWLGDARYGSGQLHGAAEAYARHLARTPQDVEARRRRADALYFQGALEEATGELDALLERNPDDAAARLRRGDAHFRQERFAKAIADYQAAQAAGTVNLPALVRMAQALEGHGRTSEAEQAYGSILERAPDRVAVWLRRGHLRLERGDADGALADYERAAELAPQRADAHVYAAEALAKLERLEEAVERYGQALQRNPSDADGWLNRGILLQRLERKGEACDAWERACRLGNGQACTYHGQDC